MAFQGGDGSAIVGYLKDARVPLWRKLVGVGALFYLVWPFDLIPDYIPILGWLDDVGVLTAAAFFYVGEIRRWASVAVPSASAAPR